MLTRTRMRAAGLDAAVLRAPSRTSLAHAHACCAIFQLEIAALFVPLLPAAPRCVLRCQLCDYPQLLDAPEAHKLFAPDAIARAKFIISKVSRAPETLPNVAAIAVSFGASRPAGSWRCVPHAVCVCAL